MTVLEMSRTFEAIFFKTASPYDNKKASEI